MNVAQVGSRPRQLLLQLVGEPEIGMRPELVVQLVGRRRVAISPEQYVVRNGRELRAPREIDVITRAGDQRNPTMSQALYDIELEHLEGGRDRLAAYRDKVLLIVNVASRCGLTPQYAGLEALYRKHKDRGLVVLGFPSNQFGAQEPGTPAEIASFCQSKYDVSFPIFAKTDVNGPAQHPLYAHLKAAPAGGAADIGWNFAKFLVGRDGELIKRYDPRTSPEQLDDDIARALGASSVDR